MAQKLHKKNKDAKNKNSSLKKERKKPRQSDNNNNDGKARFLELLSRYEITARQCTSRALKLQARTPVTFFPAEENVSKRLALTIVKCRLN